MGHDFVLLIRHSGQALTRSSESSRQALAV